MWCSISITSVLLSPSSPLAQHTERNLIFIIISFLNPARFKIQTEELVEIRSFICVGAWPLDESPIIEIQKYHIHYLIPTESSCSLQKVHRHISTGMLWIIFWYILLNFTFYNPV